MIWIDYNFDYSDQFARKYMKYKNEYYDVGTLCKIKGINGPVLVEFMGWQDMNRGCFKAVNPNQSNELYNTYNLQGVMDYCLEIITPVRPDLQPITIIQTNTNKPPSWDVEVGWIWYIVIMLITIVFKERIGLWILETFIFFTWKNGTFKGGKK